jgi:hypothetical protein
MVLKMMIILALLAMCNGVCLYFFVYCIQNKTSLILHMNNSNLVGLE